MGRTSDARERLIDEASRLFHARSYESVGVQELCDAAAVNKGSFYHFFPSKEELAGAVIDALWAATVAEVFEPAFRDDVPPLRRIERLFKNMAKAQRGAKQANGRTPGCPLANLSGELCSHEPKLRKKLARVYAEMQGLFAKQVKAAVSARELPAGTDVAAKAEALVALAEGAMLMSAVKDDPATANRMASFAITLLRG
jgi:TetR/AcrR family transcriptional regulator, transcriptional repressor for nem operon